MKRAENEHPHEMISALADKMATAQEAAQLQDHLRGCSDCRQLFHDLARIAAAVGEEAVPSPPPHLAARIRERLETRTALRQGPGAVPFWRSPFPLATAATLVLVTVFWLGWRREPPAAPHPADALQNAQLPASQAVASPPPAKTEPEKPPGATPGETQGLENYSQRLERAAPPASVPRDTEAPKASSPPEKAKENAPAPRPRRTSGELLDKVLSSGLTGEDYKKAQEKPQAEMSRMKEGRRSATAFSSASAGEAGEESPQAVLGSGPRSLVYEGPDFSATFTEEGLVTVIARGYACSVTVLPPSTFPQAGGRAPSVEDLSSLFAAAVSKEFLTTSAGTKDAEPSSGFSSSLELRNAEGDPIRTIPFAEPLPADAPQILRNLRQGILHLVRERYRKELEARCNRPLPSGILSPP